MPCFQLLSSGGQVTVAATPSPELLAMNSNSTQNLDTTRIKKTSVGCQMNYDRDLTVKEQLHFGYKTVFTTLTSWCFLFFLLLLLFFQQFNENNIQLLYYGLILWNLVNMQKETSQKKHHPSDLRILQLCFSPYYHFTEQTSSSMQHSIFPCNNHCHTSASSKQVRVYATSQA